MHVLLQTALKLNHVETKVQARFMTQNPYISIQYPCVPASALINGLPFLASGFSSPM